MSKIDHFWRRSIRLLTPRPTRKGKVCSMLGEPRTQAALLARASSVDHDSTLRPLPHRQLPEPNSGAGGYVYDQRIS